MSKQHVALWRLGARNILELPLLAASSKMETAPMAGKPDNPAMSPPPPLPPFPRRTGTRHTDTQWKAEGGERGNKNRKRSTHNAPTSHHTDK